jgi:hypothetical protein
MEYDAIHNPITSVRGDYLSWQCNFTVDQWRSLEFDQVLMDTILSCSCMKQTLNIKRRG